MKFNGEDFNPTNEIRRKFGAPKLVVGQKFKLTQRDETSPSLGCRNLSMNMTYEIIQVRPAMMTRVANCMTYEIRAARANATYWWGYDTVAVDHAVQRGFLQLV